MKIITSLFSAVLTLTIVYNPLYGNNSIYTNSTTQNLNQGYALPQTTTTNSSQFVPTTLQDGQTQSANQTTNNETLIRQHQEEEEYRKNKYGPTSDTSGVLGDAPTTGIATGNLTDTEKELSEKYVHEGLAQEKMDEYCGESMEMEQACAGMEVKHKFMGMDSNMVKALAKAYTMVVGAGLGGDLKARGAEKGKEKSQEDYCKYIAIATEVVALFQQQSAQQNLSNLPTNEETAQKDMLHRAARSHDERAKNAKIQRNGWGITAVCYTGMLTMAQLDWNLGLKLASSYFMTAFFQNEVKAHEEYRDKVLAIADKLPGRGDCNPITELDCYCTHPTTANDPQYCLPHLHKNAIATNSLRVTCVNNHLKADPSCSCRTSNTCFDQTFMNLAGPGFSNVQRGIGKPFVKLTRGELVGADGNLGALQNQAAIKNKLRQLDRSAKPKGLSKGQKKIAKVFNKLGIPPKMAGMMAKQAATAKGTSFANSLKTSGGSYSSPTYKRRRGKNKNGVLTFSGGDSLASKRKRRGSDSRSNRRRSRKKKGKSSSQVLRFAEKAASEAGISKDKSRPIFEIISRRYRLSGFKRLELE